MVIPTPIPLSRSSRRSPDAAELPEAAASTAITVLTDDGRGGLSYRDGQGRRGQAQVGAAQIGEAELGLTFYPGATAQREVASRIQDPNAGLTLSTGLTSADALPKVAAFYRAQLSALAKAGGATSTVEELSPIAGQQQLRLVDTASGLNRTVLMVQEGAQVAVTLTRWQPPAAPAAKGP